MQYSRDAVVTVAQQETQLHRIDKGEKQYPHTRTQCCANIVLHARQRLKEVELVSRDGQNRQTSKETETISHSN